MHFLEAITLGLVQGLTEFLPISSSAHLEIVPKLLGWNDPGAANTAVLQLGTVAALILYFWKDLSRITVAFVRSLFPNSRERGSVSANLAWAVVVGTIPVAVAGVLLEKKIDTVFRDPRLTGAMLIVFALALAASEKMAKQRRQIVDVNKKDGWIVGAAQAIALIPGASRSGTTITAGLLRNLNREAAARFSFLLSVPAVLLSGLYKLKDVIRPHAPLPGAPPTMVFTPGDLALATLVSFFVGYASIAFLLRYLRTNSTLIFVAYRIAAGALILYLAATGFFR